MKKFLTRLLKRPNWHNLRTLEPVSKVFGFDRGTPIDRVYIEDFIKKNSKYIKGVVCEIAENTYSRKFGFDVINFKY